MTHPIPGAGLLAGKTAVITGTAMGLGKAMAQAFVREGARVLAVDIDPTNAEALADCGQGCVPFQADVSKDDEIAAMYARAMELWGRVDIVVNNAATQSSGGPSDFSAEDYELYTELNFRGVLLSTGAAIEIMVPQGGGTIINVSSVGSLNAEDRAPVVYAAAKAAVNSLTKAVAVKYGARGIRANVLAPGFTHTEKTLQASREVIRPMEEKSAFGRAGLCEEQAQVAVFLASDRSSYVNGVVLPVDGGWSARMA